jgi:hypothetical protein
VRSVIFALFALPAWAHAEPSHDEPAAATGTPAENRINLGQWLVPLGKGVEAIASFTAGLALFAEADKLVVPQSNVQPFVSAEIGFGW